MIRELIKKFTDGGKSNSSGQPVSKPEITDNSPAPAQQKGEAQGDNPDEGYIRINSEGDFNLPIKTAEVRQWLRIICEISGEDDLTIGLKRCSLRVLNEEQTKAVGTIRLLICHEASGNIKPPINIYKTYREIARAIKEGS